MYQLVPAVLGTALVLSAQQIREGYASRVDALPAADGNVLVLPNGGVVSFDGSDLWHRPPGQPATSLLHFASPVFGSFTIDAGGGDVLFGENLTGGLWRVPLQGPAPTAPLASLALNYDAVLFAPQRAIVSAKTSGFGGPDNDVVAIDLQTGATQLLAQLPGASGPLAVDDAGHLYYATASNAFPAPPGQTSVLRFRRAVVDAALAANHVLGAGDGELVIAGLDSASDLAFDGDGDLLFVDWFDFLNPRIGEIDDAAGAAARRSDLIGYAGAPFSAGGLQFLPAAAGAAFEPFQPAGGTLVVHEASFGSLSQLRFVHARRATLAASTPSPIAAGPFALVAAHGPAHGAGIVLLAFPPFASESPFVVPGFEQALWLSPTLLPALASHVVAFDGSGAAALPMLNPGFAVPLAVVAQLAFVDATARTLGTTAPTTALLGP
jgi:hypothetical protein